MNACSNKICDISISNASRMKWDDASKNDLLMQERKVRKSVTHFRTTYAHVPGADAKFVELATRLRGSTWEEPIRKGAKKFVTHFETTCDHVTFRPRRTWREWRVWLMLMQHFYAKREQEPPSFINLCRNLFHAPKCFTNCKQVEIKLSPILNPHFPAAPNLVWDQNIIWYKVLMSH